MEQNSITTLKGSNNKPIIEMGISGRMMRGVLFQRIRRVRCFLRQQAQMRRSNFAGSKKTDLIMDSMLSTAIPNKRNGSNSSHTIGYNTIASIASGAQSTNNINQSKNVTIVFI